MIDLDALEKEARNGARINASPKWLMVVVRELRGNRQRIADLETDNAQLRTEVARLRSGLHTTTTKTTIIRGGKTTVTESADFPQKEMDEAFGFMDKAFASLDRVLGKVGKKK